MDAGRFYPGPDPSTSVFFPHFEDISFTPIGLNQIRDLPYDPSLEQQDDGFLYKFNVAYDVTSDFLAYFTVSQGYRTGASNGLGGCADFDPNANQGSCALAPGQQFGPNPDDISRIDERQYFPDKTTNYEIGAKTTWLDGDLVLNGALFFVEWEDPQVSSATVNANIPITVNAAAAESVGVELQSSWYVTDQFKLDATYSYSKAELTEQATDLVRGIEPPGFGTVFFDGEVGDQLPGAPEQLFSLFGQYTTPFAGEELVFAGGYSYQGEILTRAGGRGGSIPIDSFGVAKASMTYNAEAWSATLYVNNLFDEYIETGIVSTPLSNQVVSDINGDPVTVRSHYATLGAPRTIGVRFKYRFN